MGDICSFYRPKCDTKCEVTSAGSMRAYIGSGWFKPNPIRAVLELPKTRSNLHSGGFDYLRTDQMFGPMPILVKALHSM
jgi:hypothetical protein